MGILIDGRVVTNIPTTRTQTEDTGSTPDHEVRRWKEAYGAADAGSLGAVDGVETDNSETPETPRLTKDELAERHAPILVLPDGDYDLPSDPADFIDNSVWGTDRTAMPDSIFGIGIHGDNTEGDRAWHGFGGEDTGDNFTAAEVGERGQDNQYLDLDDDKRGELGSEDAPFFYEVETDEDGNTTRITYWFFYAYNDGPGPQNHEGDFERITIGFDPETQEPTRARYSAHSNNNTEAVDFDEVETWGDTQRPIVYVAEGTHASFMHPGDHDSDAPVLAGTPPLDDNTVSGLDDESATIIDTSNNLHDVTQQDWYPEEGKGIHWGQIGDADGLPLWGSSSSGPYGPSEGKNHLDLD